jgi:hypothetical protein
MPLVRLINPDLPGARRVEIAAKVAPAAPGT